MRHSGAIQIKRKRILESASVPQRVHARVRTSAHPPARAYISSIHDEMGFLLINLTSPH